MGVKIDKLKAGGFTVLDEFSQRDSDMLPFDRDGHHGLCFIRGHNLAIKVANSAVLQCSYTALYKKFFPFLCLDDDDLDSRLLEHELVSWVPKRRGRGGAGSGPELRLLDARAAASGPGAGESRLSRVQPILSLWPLDAPPAGQAPLLLSQPPAE